MKEDASFLLAGIYILILLKLIPNANPKPYLYVKSQQMLPLPADALFSIASRPSTGV